MIEPVDISRLHHEIERLQSVILDLEEKLLDRDQDLEGLQRTLAENERLKERLADAEVDAFTADALRERLDDAEYERDGYMRVNMELRHYANVRGELEDREGWDCYTSEEIVREAIDKLRSERDEVRRQRDHAYELCKRLGR